MVTTNSPVNWDLCIALFSTNISSSNLNWVNLPLILMEIKNGCIWRSTYEVSRNLYIYIISLYNLLWNINLQNDILWIIPLIKIWFISTLIALPNLSILIEHWSYYLFSIFWRILSSIFYFSINICLVILIKWHLHIHFSSTFNGIIWLFLFLRFIWILFQFLLLNLLLYFPLMFSLFILNYL